MELEIALSKKQIVALLSHAGTSDVRSTLNGICFKVSSCGQVALISTDGHRLLVWGPCDAVTGCTLKAGDYIVRRDQLEQALRFRVHPKLGYSLRVDVAGCTVDAPGMARSRMDLIPGKYPCVAEAIRRAIVPDGESNRYRGATGQEFYRPEYLIDQRESLLVLAGNAGKVDVGRGVFCRQSNGVLSVVMPQSPPTAEGLCRIDIPNMD